MMAKFNEPIFIYIRVIAKMRNTEATAPVIRYLIPASSATGVFL